MNQDIWSTLKQIIHVTEIGIGSTCEDEKLLLKSLDSIAFQMHDLIPDEPKSFIELPENDYTAIRAMVESRFPNWGYYNIAENVTLNVGSSSVKVGDAIDDITDIIDDLKKVLWSYENEDESIAAWHLHDSFYHNWRWHLRHLQLYLYCLEMEI